mmetsp:Transcript_4460/g.15883  ORF Transcript_4460/g.15883 Transcript_4460/m.15883 type:complete len:84 (+) Transcript_4460:1619-1870(+)
MLSSTLLVGLVSIALNLFEEPCDPKVMEHGLNIKPTFVHPLSLPNYFFADRTLWRGQGHPYTVEVEVPTQTYPPGSGSFLVDR